jgi:hypothetical protein
MSELNIIDMENTFKIKISAIDLGETVDFKEIVELFDNLDSNNRSILSSKFTNYMKNFTTGPTPEFIKYKHGNLNVYKRIAFKFKIYERADIFKELINIYGVDKNIKYINGYFNSNINTDSIAKIYYYLDDGRIIRTIKTPYYCTTYYINVVHKLGYDRYCNFVKTKVSDIDTYNKIISDILIEDSFLFNGYYIDTKISYKDKIKLFPVYNIKIMLANCSAAKNNHNIKNINSDYECNEHNFVNIKPNDLFEIKY